MSAFARSQTRLPERGALAASGPVPVVFQLPSMVSPLTITSGVVPPSRLTPIQAEESRSSASPARSSSRIEVWSSWTVAVEVGPWMRWVRVLRAQYRSSVTVAVRRVGPLSTDHLGLSGLWFHSHRGLRVVPSKVSTPIIGVTWRGGVGTAGLGYEVPHAPCPVHELQDGPAARGPGDRCRGRHPAAGVRVHEGHVVLGAAL